MDNVDNVMDTLKQNFESFSGGKKGFEFIRLDLLAQKIGTSEILVRFIMGILAGFPLSVLYLSLPKQTKNSYKHLYFAVTGVLINYFCFGSDCMYNIFSVVVAYLTLQLFGGTTQSVIFAFLFQTSYLMAGYIKNASDGYDVKWTTPQCVLCLRLIALTWNVYDGRQKEESLSPDQKSLSVKNNPSLLKIFGYTYCFCGLLSGLQYSFRLYVDFVEDKLIGESVKDKTNPRFVECFKRFFGAISILLLFTVLDPYYKTEDLLLPSFLEMSFASKVIQMAFVYYVQYTKYIIVWWFGESVSMFLGLSYNGLDEEGNAKWDGVNNFKFRTFVLGPFYADIVTGFNILTNQWSGRYVFRRLRFLGNKSASHVLTLLYLAIWHGFYVGYFIMFFIEFVYVTWEKHYCAVLRKLFNVSYDELPAYIRLPLQVTGVIFKIVSCGFPAMAFLILRWRKIKVLFATVYYWPVFVVGLWYLLIGPLLKQVIKARKIREPSTEKKKEE